MPARKASIVPRRGDIIRLDFDPSVGHEQQGTRPALVLSPVAFNRFGMALACPITRGGAFARGQAWTVPLAGAGLATDGVVLYVLTQRALAAGTGSLGNTKQLVAGDPAGELITDWQQLAGPPEALSTDYVFHGGVYGASEKLFALNRTLAEDQAAVLPDPRVARSARGR